MRPITEQLLQSSDGEWFRVQVLPDDDAPSPRAERDTSIATMCLRHRDRVLPDEDTRVTSRLMDPDRGPLSWRAVEHWIRSTRGATVVLPVYAAADGPSAIQACEPTYYSNVPWDSNTFGELLGVVYDDTEQVRRLGVPAEQVEWALKMEVDRYETWADGGFCYWEAARWVPACEHGHTGQWVLLDPDGRGPSGPGPEEALAAGLAHARTAAGIPDPTAARDLGQQG